MTITFNNTWGAGVASAPAGFQTTILAVEAFFNQQFSDTLTLNVTYDWQPLNPGWVSGGFTLGSNNFALHSVSYTDIRNALIAHQATSDANPGDDAAAIAALPVADPAPTTGSNTVRYLVTNGQEKLLGLNGVGPNDNLGADATIVLASDTPGGTFFDFDRSDGIGASGLDAFGTFAHEISEGLMGRIMSGGGVPSGGSTNDYNIMDLYHYGTGGIRTMLQVAGNRFSFSGTTGDANLNRVLDSSGDIADPSTGADPRNSFADASSGTIQAVTQSDLRIMDVLGWTRVNNLDDHNQSDTGATTVLGDDVSGINGSLELQGDHDWFKVTLDSAKHYQINIVGSTLADPFLALYAGAGASRDTDTPTRTNDDGGGGGNSRLSIDFGNGGTYFVDVGAIGDSVSPKTPDVGMGTYNVTLIGNTPPVLSADAGSPHALAELTGVTGSLTPDAVSGLLSFTDPDVGDTHTASASLNSATWSGGVTIPAASLTALGSAMTDSIAVDATSGALSWQFSLQDKNVDFLAVNETLTVVYDLTLADHRTGSPFSDTSIQQVTVVFTGTNDAPVLVGASSTLANSLSELLGVTGSLAIDSTSGVIAFSDPDLNDRPTPQAINSALQTVTWQDATHDYTSQLTAAQIPLLKAGFSITPQGGNTNTGNVDWAYNVVDKNLDFLGVDESLTITTPVTMDDHNGGTFTANVVVTVNGANDPPVAVPDSNGVAKGGKLSVTPVNGVLSNDTDPDIHDQGGLFVSQVNGVGANVAHSVKGVFGSLTLNANGSYTYQGSDKSLPSKIVAQDIFQYTLSDSHGGTDTANLYIVLFSPGTLYQKGVNTTLFGSNGNDVLDGFAGHVNMFGGNGSDVLIGGNGDTMSGGSRPDIYLFRPEFGVNTISDFELSNDHMQFDKSIFASAFDILHNHTVDTLAGAVISDGLGDSVTLTGIHAAQLSASMFFLA